MIPVLLALCDWPVFYSLVSSDRAGAALWCHSRHHQWDSDCVHNQRASPGRLATWTEDQRSGLGGSVASPAAYTHCSITYDFDNATAHETFYRDLLYIQYLSVFTGLVCTIKSTLLYWVIGIGSSVVFPSCSKDRYISNDCCKPKAGLLPRGSI